MHSRNNRKHFIGEKINKYTIFDISESESRALYHVKCECGKERRVSSSHLSRLTQCWTCSASQHLNDYIGKKFGSLLVISHEIYQGQRKLKVKCDCGNETYVESYRLRNQKNCFKCKAGFFPGKTTNGCELLKKLYEKKGEFKCHCGNIFISRISSRVKDCGCQYSKLYLGKLKDKIGNKFGKLKVINFKKGYQHNILVCKCKCGNVIEIINGHESRQNSCGCLRKENNPRAEKKGNARFKNFEILSLRQLNSTGIYSVEELSKIYNISKNYISRIVNNHIWKNI